ncbi:hypothetical protein ATZ33_05925 [Enterococcus silesiacus]|uniref:Uncharacterized protein n=2 Tax=Enterococcus silesiacus TaxID=332949 RepID=A0ABN4J505_9ENTE|nr:conjugal transfer protein [Enterococcus silesiacus]ALS00922.1 hypothetical protein ATZ33_05925 [Enterococcus silesiacus]
MLPEIEAKPYKDWLEETFLPKYCSDTAVEEMRRMMKEPKVLGKVRRFNGLTACDIYDDGSRVLAYVVVKMIDPVTQTIQEREINLTISIQKEKLYRVERVDYFGKEWNT